MRACQLRDHAGVDIGTENAEQNVEPGIGVVVYLGVGVVVAQSESSHEVVGDGKV